MVPASFGENNACPTFIAASFGENNACPTFIAASFGEKIVLTAVEAPYFANFNATCASLFALFSEKARRRTADLRWN